MAQDAQLIKFRLIGAVVVLVGLTLAWWLLLDNDVKRYQETREAIPARIDIERFDVEKPQPVSLSNHEPVQSKPETQAIKSEKKAAANEVLVPIESETHQQTASTKPAITQPPKVEKKIQHNEQTGLPIAYVVQVGSFGKQENAEQLKKRLLEKQLPAYVKRFNLPQGTVYRVLIGPKLSRGRAEEVLPFIKLELNLEGQVLRYQPGFEE